MPRQQGGGKYKTLTGKLQCSLLLKGTLWFRSQWRRATLKKKSTFLKTLLLYPGEMHKQSEKRVKVQFMEHWTTCANLIFATARDVKKKYAKKKKKKPTTKTDNSYKTKTHNQASNGKTNNTHKGRHSGTHTHIRKRAANATTRTQPW